MNHAERCQALLKAAEAAGYAFYTNDRGAASGPSNCAKGYIFYSKTTGDKNYQMFRGYVHDVEDIIYLRVNFPNVTYGLGQEPFKIDLQLIAEPVLGIDATAALNAAIKEFFQTTAVPTQLVEHLIQAENRKDRVGRKEAVVSCALCHGTGTFERHGLEDPCKLCRGKGDRTLVTETYYLRDE